MAAVDMASSSPAPGGFANLKEEIEYYKKQYEHLESELQDFQASSRDLEAELEKDIEASEKRERSLREKVESLNYEAEEWKTKYKQSKTEAGNAQNSLQKEITALREQNRTQQLRLRDVEVANDDFERQARHTTSSLEDLESKYNQAIERSVMMEEEIKASEQEREALRIENQRVRDELGDLKIEAEITQEKLRSAENAAARRSKHISQLSDSHHIHLQSPTSEASLTSAPSNFTHTKSDSSIGGSDALTPPSPPLSEQSGPKQNAESAAAATAAPPAAVAASEKAPDDPNTTPKAPGAVSALADRARAQSRASLQTPGQHPPAFKRRAIPTPRPSGVGHDPMPRSGSLYQIRGLIGKMQKLEQRVHSARSKLPAPTHTPPRASPRAGPATDVHGNNSALPANVTVRSSKKRSSASTMQSHVQSASTDDRSSRLSRRHSRVSFGGAADISSSRPSSRASNASNGGFVRPSSRIEAYGSGARSIPEPHRPASAADTRRPRSSLGGRTTPSLVPRPGPASQSSQVGTDDDGATPTLRKTMDKGVTGIPTPAGLGRRQSAQTLSGGTMRRQSTKQQGAPALNSGHRDSDAGAGARDSESIGETW